MQTTDYFRNDVLAKRPYIKQEWIELALAQPTLDVAGVPVRLAQIDDLIAFKQSAGRPIDLSDIEHLKKLRPA